MFIVNPPASLRAFLVARAAGATAQELNHLIAADKARRAADRGVAEDVVIDFDQARRRRKPAQAAPIGAS